MMNCPLCGNTTCHDASISSTNATGFNCKKYKRVFKVGASIDIYKDDEKQRRLKNLIFEYVIHNPYADDENTKWWFFYEPTYRCKEEDEDYRVNLAEIKYPVSLSEKIDRILMNLYYINSSYGYSFNKSKDIVRALFAENDEEEKHYGIIQIMIESNYLSSNIDGFFKIASKGWQRIDELLRQKADNNQGFIAMAFKKETDIIREAFRKGIHDAGYNPLVIDEKEHNNQIVPEIFDEIDKSKFLVMDVTYPNYGAYYEAGYALGKGKQVIICCGEEAFKNSDDRPHFDIAQKSMIVWKTVDELTERLTKRILATVK